MSDKPRRYVIEIVDPDEDPRAVPAFVLALCDLIEQHGWQPDECLHEERS